MNTHTPTHHNHFGVVCLKINKQGILSGQSLSLGVNVVQGEGRAQMFTPQCWCEAKTRPCL